MFDNRNVLCEQASSGSSNMETVMQHLERRKIQAEKSLADINAAIALLTEQPKLLEALEVLRRIGI